MATKILAQPFLWKRFTGNSLDTYLGLPGEPIIDLRTGVPQLRLCDGVTPGGHPIGGGGALSGVALPFILSPMDGATGVAKSPVITASRFHGIKVDTTADTHVASFWEVSTDPAFGTFVYKSGRTSADLTSIDLQARGVILARGRKYARVAYEGEEGGVSSWSPVVSFDVFAVEPGAVIEGDIVVGQLNGFWLLAAPATKRKRHPWGLYNVDTTLPNLSSAGEVDPNSGKYNTDVLTSPPYSKMNDGEGSVGSPAAKYCRFQLNRSYDLPNKEELNLIYKNKALIDASDSSGGVNTLSNIAEGKAEGSTSNRAWSSSECSSYLAWYQMLLDGSQNVAYTKRNEYWVLPVRRIPV